MVFTHVPSAEQRKPVWTLSVPIVYPTAIFTGVMRPHAFVTNK